MVGALRFGPSGRLVISDEVSAFQPASDEFRDLYSSALDRRRLRKFGSNSDVDQAQSQDIWEGSSVAAPNNFLYPGFLQTAEKLRAVSSSNDDAVGGLGAWSVELQPHDENFNWLQNENQRISIELNGTTLSSLTSGSFIRMTRGQAKGVGTYANGNVTGSNVGNIQILTESGILVGYISAGQTNTKLGIMTVPRGWDFFLQVITIGISDQQPADIEVFARTAANVVTAPFSERQDLFTFVGVQGSARPFELEADGLKFPEYTDIWSRVTAGSNDTTARVELRGLMLRHSA